MRRNASALVSRRARFKVIRHIFFSPSCIGTKLISSTAAYTDVLFMFLNLLEGESKTVQMCL